MVKSPIDEVIGIAKDEVGYLEKASNSNLDSKTANAGRGNYTKYWRDLKPSFQGQPYCDAFVKWVFVKAFGRDIASKLFCGGIDSYNTVTSAKYFDYKNRLDRNPLRGDQVFFSSNGTIDGIYHTGIVTNFDGKNVYTIEGNTSGGSTIIPNGGAVVEKSYPMSVYKNKLFFGHPDYNIVKEAEAPGESVNYAATVTVNTYLNVRTGPGTSYSKFKVNNNELCLPNGLIVAILEEKNGFGRIGNINGWVSLSYLRK